MAQPKCGGQVSFLPVKISYKDFTTIFTKVQYKNHRSEMAGGIFILFFKIAPAQQREVRT